MYFGNSFQMQPFIFVKSFDSSAPIFYHDVFRRRPILFGKWTWTSITFKYVFWQYHNFVVIRRRSCCPLSCYRSNMIRIRHFFVFMGASVPWCLLKITDAVIRSITTRISINQITLTLVQIDLVRLKI